MKELLLYLSLKYNGDFDKIYSALQLREKVDGDLKNKLFNDFYSRDCSYTTLVSEDYPDKLKQISCPPFVVFYRGDLSLADRKSVAVVGSLKPSEYGRKCTELYVDELSKKENVIISEMQKGTGTAVLEQAVKSNTKAVAVFLHGMNEDTSIQNKKLYDEICKNGLVMGEYPYSSKQRENDDLVYKQLRLVPGIADTVLLTETETKSKYHAVVNYALEQGRKVCAIPSGVLNKDMQGNNELIKMGADLVTSPEDIDRNVNTKDRDVPDHNDIEIEL